jgi:hypothetical protein
MLIIKEILSNNKDSLYIGSSLQYEILDKVF